MKTAFVEPLALADREELEVVVVVGDDRELRVDCLPVHGQTDAVPVTGEEEQRAELGESVSSAPVTLATVNERGVEAERDVVEEEPVADAPHVDRPLGSAESVKRAERIVAVEAEVARKVVARPKGDADERQAPFDRHLGHCGQRPVAAGDTERVGVRLPRELGRIVFGSEDPRVDPAVSRLVQQLLRARASSARARVNE